SVDLSDRRGGKLRQPDELELAAVAPSYGERLLVGIARHHLEGWIALQRRTCPLHLVLRLAVRLAGASGQQPEQQADSARGLCNASRAAAGALRGARHALRGARLPARAWRALHGASPVSVSETCAGVAEAPGPGRT